MNALRWIRQLLTRGRMARDVADEIDLHLEEKIDELMAAGLTRAAAAAAARRAFGNVTLVREESRDVWRWRPLDDVLGDIRYAARQLRRAPSFAAAAILTLAIGIGANSAVFSVVNTVVLRPLPFPSPDRLVSVELMSIRGTPHPDSLAYFTFFELRRAAVVERIACYRDAGMTLTGGDLPLHLQAMVVSWDLFELLGVTPTLGRGFLPEEEAPSARVVVLSHDVWQTQFGADPAIVGRAITLDGEPNTVVGVAPAGFTYPIERRPIQIWTTLARDASSKTVQPITEQRGARLLNAVARLPPGMSVDQARAQLDGVTARLAAEYPDSNKNLPATYVRPELHRLLGDARGPILILWGAVTLVLLIACANIANMLLARTADRQREFAVRVAIGGPRGRIVRQLLTENLVIALLGGAAAVIVAVGGVSLLFPLIADYMPRAADVSIDGGVLAFTIGLALVTAVLVSVPPALWITRTEFGGSTRADSRGSTDTQERARGALVVAQVAIGLILLCGASVMAAGFLNLTRRDLGFHPENLFSFRVELSGPRYSTDAQDDFMDQLLERLKTVPGVTDATLGMPLPLTGDEMAVAFNIRERPTGPTERPSSNMALVAPGYFQTIGTPLLAGRDFTDEDDGRHPRVLVVNQAFAERFFPGANAIGKQIESGATSQRDSRGVAVVREIVGVVGNARQSARSRDPEPIYYFPYKQLPWGPPSVIVRSTLPVAGIAPHVRQIVAALDPQAPVHDVKTLSGMLSEGMAPPRFLTLLMASFAGIGLMLTATGLYGLLAYAVSRRSREIGVRMALGASRRSIIKMILSRALLLVAIGMGIGGAGAAAVQAVLQRVVFSAEGAPPLGWLLGAAVVVLLTALAAVCPPAMRAASIDPSTALRAE
jgi:putative ABC transport system permease protein